VHAKIEQGRYAMPTHQNWPVLLMFSDYGYFYFFLLLYAVSFIREGGGKGNFVFYDKNIKSGNGRLRESFVYFFFVVVLLLIEKFI
jgi:hypothetical protein